MAGNPPGATFGPRRLGDFEFVLMLDGDARHDRDGEAVDVPEGAAVLCRPGGVDAFAWDARRASRHGYAHFDVESVPPGFPPIEAWPRVRALGPGDVWRPMFFHLLALSAGAAGGDGASRELSRGVMGHLLASFVLGRTGAAEVAAPPPLPDPVARAVGHLSRRLSRDPSADVTLAELADAACVTPAYLCRAFRAATGDSPLGAVRARRLDAALAMLTRSNAGVAQVAAACGFASPYHFSRRFKSAFGQSPTAVRAGVRAGRTPPLPRGHLRFARAEEQTGAAAPEVNGGHGSANAGDGVHRPGRR